MEISQKIIDYSIWYYLRYYPSPKKLEQKLIHKFWKNSENGKKYWWIWNEEIIYILENKLKNIIQENEVIKSKIRSYKSKWKSKLYIKQKLYERMEEKHLIEIYLEEAFVDWEIENLKKQYEKIKEISSKKEYNKQKIIEKLIRKWFKYYDIKNIVI